MRIDCSGSPLLSFCGNEFYLFLCSMNCLKNAGNSARSRVPPAVCRSGGKRRGNAAAKRHRNPSGGACRRDARHLSEEDRDNGAAIKKAIEGVISDLVFQLQSETTERTRARL
jgi:hypothetical protein